MRERRRRRSGWRAVGTLAACMMAWSAIAAPSSVSQEQPIAEPAELAAYAAFADGAPVQLYFDHQTRFVPLGPSIARSFAEVAMPSAATGTAWLVDMGIANGLHGTTTGAKVPTEASASQPGGEPSAEFSVAGGPIGDPAFMRVGAGRARAQARHSDQPRGYAAAHAGQLVILPAPGSPEDPGGTFDPDARFPGGDPDGTDPAPRGQMAVVAIGSVASTGETLRDGTKVTSISVAELKEINIGNRTADNRCTNCIRIDSIRVEAIAEANGSSARARHRVLLGRACRRGFNAEEGVEEDRCLPLDPGEPRGTQGVQEVKELDRLNAAFEEPIWTVVTDGAVGYAIGVRLHAGSEHREEARSRRTADPRDDPRRNYSSADRGGETARAVAEGPDVEVWTITTSQVIEDAASRIEGTPAAEALRRIDEDPAAPGIQITAPGPAGGATGMQTIPLETVRSVRRVHLTLGVARAAAVARASGGAAALAPDGVAPPGAAALPPGGAAGVPGIGGAPEAGSGGGGFPAGPFRLVLDWSKFDVSPWPPADMAKGIAFGGITLGFWVLARRRLHPL